MVAVGESHLEHDGPAHGTRVSRMDSSAERGVKYLVNRGFNLLIYSVSPLSTLRTCMVFADRFADRVQQVAWPDSAVRLELFRVVFEQEIDGVQWPALLQELTFGDIFNHA